MPATRILVVEDQNIIALDLQSRLTGLGYEVPVILAHGEEAVLHCQADLPDLILMDIRLKGQVDGIQAAERIRTFADLPIIYLTAHSDDQTLARAQQTEPHGYLLKPFEDRELRLTIEIALYKHSMERQLRDNERWLGAVLRGIGEGVIASDVHGIVRLVNPVAVDLIGRPAADIVGRPIADVFTVVDAQTRARLPNPLLQAIGEQKSVTLPERALLLSGDGREIPIDDSAALIHDSRSRIAGAVLVFRDITERLRTEQQLRHLAYHDELTGLPNRALFQILTQRAVTEAQRSGGRVGVIFLDLDRFKMVNDSLGHSVGDRLLGAVAARLSAVLPPGAMLARFGGDEFTLLLEALPGPEEASGVSERILAALAAPFELIDQEFYVGASIGISLFPEDGSDAATLIRNADAALYRVKDRGRNGYAFYQAEMNAGALSRLALEAQLRHALERGEFALHFQPRVDLMTGHIRGVEALIRWNQPEVGLIAPLQFLGLAEETGLILPIGAWVLETACRQARTWRENGLPDLRVAVNLSNRQFRHPDLIDTIASILAETGLPAPALELEMTETIVMHDRLDAIAKIKALKQMGVRLAIDDFGTGYSSLAYLKRLPITTLKIDKTFITDLNRDPDDTAITTTVITMAHSLGLTVVAEGVETETQLRFLDHFRCDEVQGYWLSRPVDPDTCLGFLRDWPRAVPGAPPGAAPAAVDRA